MLRTGSEGCTSSKLGEVAISVTAVKSRSVS